MCRAALTFSSKNKNTRAMELVETTGSSDVERLEKQKPPDRSGGFALIATLLLAEQRNAFGVLRLRDRRQIGVHVGDIGVRQDLLAVGRHRSVGRTQECRERLE